MDECVTEQGKDCDPMNMWLQVPFFCGHAAACWEATRNLWALEQAKLNLANKYVPRGVTEEMEDFVALLEHNASVQCSSASDLVPSTGEVALSEDLQQDHAPSQPPPEHSDALPSTRPKLNFYQLLSISFTVLKKRTLMVKADRLVDRGQQYFFEKIRPRSRDGKPQVKDRP
ncbi:putative Heparan sulfate 2-O-sulfotransferase 1 [Hypsibius exemplaris]|uniref:Heparan sulfate 2-O-sulfotransferase 1 n=1 Tax=Hypsibius exemplaris TaxID=2072580 RepID=A0A9X6NLL3_HYPEX|nr:putative Heparan sulfate 2-O-sulfotransferase 1 [Hypsibius exemplaris]